MFIQKKCANLKKNIPPILKDNASDLVKKIEKVANQQKKIKKNNETEESVKE